MWHMNLVGERGKTVLIGRVFQTCFLIELLSVGLGQIQKHSEMRSENWSIATHLIYWETKPQNV